MDRLPTKVEVALQRITMTPGTSIAVSAPAEGWALSEMKLSPTVDNVLEVLWTHVYCAECSSSWDRCECAYNQRTLDFKKELEKEREASK